jgi:hypothetical protein
MTRTTTVTDITPIETGYQHWVRISVDGCGMDAGEAEAMAPVLRRYIGCFRGDWPAALAAARRRP